MTRWENSTPASIKPGEATDEAAVAHAILLEIQAMVQKLLDEGCSGSMDFNTQPPMAPAVYDFLKRWLSVGEVAATVAGQGRTDIRETHYPGVWWLTHRDDCNQVVREAVEVTEIPEILKSNREDIRSGLREMSEHLLGAWQIEGTEA